jgi:hypothetical protein
MISLTQQVSQLTPIDDATLQAVRAEVRSLEESWTNVYSEYHTGGWQTLSLLNNTSEPTDTVITDCDPVETSLLARMPHTRALLKRLGFTYMWVRLAKLEPNAFMLEHRDYKELKRVGRLRLHIPIITNAAAAIVIERLKIFIAPGYVWKLNPVFPHAANNFGAEPRIHLILDCYVDERLTAMLREETLDESFVQYLPSPTRAELDRAVTEAARLARFGDFEMAEHSLLKLFHFYHLKEGFAYELVARMYDSLGDCPRRGQWMENKTKFLCLETAAAAAATAPTGNLRLAVVPAQSSVKEFSQ